MLSITLGIALLCGGTALLSWVFFPDMWRAYFYRPRHTGRAVAARHRREADPHWQAEQWFHEWRKQYPALLEETRAMPRVHLTR